MTIPDYQTLILPALKFHADRGEHTLIEAYNHLADEFHLTEEERNELLPSGNERTFYNRVRWAFIYLKKAGLLEKVMRGMNRITPRGTDVLKESPQTINDKYLMRFEEFREFKNADSKPEEATSTVKEKVVEETDSTQTPDEAIQEAYRRMRENLIAELLKNVKQASPEFFERLVVQLLVKMGYGGSIKDAGQAVGRSGDGGIDGIIKEDILGLDIIYIQAKRWENVVGRPEIHRFIGALNEKQAKKGVFITTSGFTRDAKDSASLTSEPKIVLVDGNRLAEFMIDFNLGVSKGEVYEIKTVDTDFFVDD